MRCRNFGLLLALATTASAQGTFPLESLAVEGSAIPQPMIMEIAGLRLGSPVDKTAIDAACGKLQDSGLFTSAAYRYAQGPKKGYALTLTLGDQTRLIPAIIDVPGADETEAWQWLKAKFHRFDHQVPPGDGAQKYLGDELEHHIGAAMRGQHMTVRVITDLGTRKSILSFQPEVLPKVQSVAFTGNQGVPTAELKEVTDRLAVNDDYTARKFASIVEMNLRPVYETHGYYRVQLTPSAPQWSGDGVSLSVAIVEGSTYQMGKVDVQGESLPASDMLSAANLPAGKLANWMAIQQGIWEMERVVKRTGYFEAVAATDRSYDDAARILNLTIRVNKGPLYHFGEARFPGLTPDLENKARALWKPKPGDPYNYAYPSDFLKEFSRQVDFRNFKKYTYNGKPAAGDHVMDIEVAFETK